MAEQIDLNGPTPPPNPTDFQAPGNSINHIAVAVADLSTTIAPGDTNEVIVDKLLQHGASDLIPWEDCSLPSRGYYYGWVDGTVKVRAMGQTAEKVLANQRLAQSGQSIEYLFRECCKFPEGFDPVDLLLGDRVFLLYFLRGITHGQIYEFTITCPNCGVAGLHSYDLNELVQTMTVAQPELGVEPFKVSLPYASQSLRRDVWVGVRFLRAADANAMLAAQKARKKAIARPGNTVRTRSKVPQQQSRNEILDDTISNNMEKIIVSIMGVSDPFKVRRFISQMHAQDTAAVREWLREHTPGIDNTVTVTCQDCSHEFTVELPFTESFFRPAKSS